MKKFLTRILISVLSAATIAATFSFGEIKAFADAVPTTTSTEIFLPTTYLQYYKLENPYAICREEVDGKEFVAISHKGALVIYSDGRFNEITVPELAAEEGVPALQLYKEKYLLFTAGSKLWTLNAATRDVTETEVSGNNFSISGDTLAIATNTDIQFYTLTADDSGLSIVRQNDKKIEANNIGAVLLSSDGNVYFFHDGKIKYYDGTAKRDILAETEVKSIAESKDPNDENIYYSCSRGVYAFDRNRKTDTDVNITAIKTVAGTAEEKDLGKLWQPQGICLTGKGLWVVDKEINAVQEIDLSANDDGTFDYDFTDFAITTNSKAINRLSAEAKDVAYYNDTVYALDENRVVVIGNADGEKDDRNYRRIELAAKADKFAVGGGYIAYTAGKNVTFGAIPKAVEGVYVYPLTDTSTYACNDQIYDICYGDKAFYVLTNVIKDGKNHPSIVKIDYSTGETSVITDEAAEGIAERMAVDPFDRIYVYARNGGEFVVYAYDGNTPSKIYSSTEEFAANEKIIKMQTDFDGKLYFLTDGGTVVRLNETSAPTGVYEKSLSVGIEKSPNLAGVGNPASMCLGAESKKAYFVFGGLILRSDEPGENALGVSTVNTVSIPDGFGYKFDADLTFGKMKDNAKLFAVNPEKTDEAYFAFLENGYLTETANADYAFVKISDKYSLAVNAGVAAIVRNGDIAAADVYAEESLTRYALVDFKTYALPVLTSPYGANVSAETNERLAIVGKIDFNGKTYFVVEKGEERGFIDSAFVTETPIYSETTVIDKSGYVYDKDGVTLYDDTYADTGDKIKGKTKVRILYERDGYAKVRLADGSEAFVTTDSVTYDSSDDFVKCLVAVLCASSFLVLALFFERKYLFSKI